MNVNPESERHQEEVIRLVSRIFSVPLLGGQWVPDVSGHENGFYGVFWKEESET